VARPPGASRRCDAPGRLVRWGSDEVGLMRMAADEGGQLSHGAAVRGLDFVDTRALEEARTIVGEPTRLLV